MFWSCTGAVVSLLTEWPHLLLRVLLAVFTLLGLNNVYELKASDYTKSFFDESNFKTY
jgi:hypothetical protein